MKTLRLIAALFLALGSLFFVTPAQATDEVVAVEPDVIVIGSDPVLMEEVPVLAPEESDVVLVEEAPVILDESPTPAPEETVAPEPVASETPAPEPTPESTESPVEPPLVEETPIVEEVPPTVIVTNGGDDSSYEIPLDAPIVFCGVEYSSIYATTNAVITFGQPDGTFWDFPQTTSISMGSQDWVTYPTWRPDEHFIISYTPAAFQVDMAGRWIGAPTSVDVSRMVFTGTINEDRTVTFSYYLEGVDQYDNLRFGVRTPDGQVLTLEEAGFYQNVEAPAEEGEIMAPEPEPVPTEEPTVEPSPTPSETSNPTPVVPEPTETPSPTTSPEPEPTPTLPEPEVSPEPEVTVPPVSPEPEPTQTPEPSPTPEVTPEPEPTPSPENSSQPEPSPEPEPAQPVVTPTPEPPAPVAPEPTPTETPTPTQTLEPEPEVTPTPTPSSSIDPEPVPEVTPAPEPTPTPTVTQPSAEPTPTVAPTPEPSPEPTPTQVPEPVQPTLQEVTSDTPISDVVLAVETLDPSSLTDEQAAVLVSVAYATFETAEKGSEEYDQALELLAVAAIADDPELPEELAAIPLVGNVAGAVLDVFNEIGNVGADMSPQVREQSEKVVVAAVIVGQVAMTATAAATSAAAAAARKP